MRKKAKKIHIKKRHSKDILRYGLFNKEKFILKAIIITCSILLISLIAYKKVFTPSILLKGNLIIKINYKQKYKEPGYNAYYFGKNITEKVKMKGKVNSKKLGKYQIIYYINNSGSTKKVKRTVIVEDKTPPSIQLIGDDNYYVCPNKKYKEPGYKAVDNYDGDITSKVKVTTKNNIIYYSVKDSTGNVKEISRKIEYKDIDSPKITLNGGDMIYSYINEDYNEPGYEAIDNCDGNITKKVQIEGKVDTKTPNTSSITYIVKDSSGNEKKISRKIVVKEHTAKGSIYLTFDDGPRQNTTNVILDILKEENVKATFFVTNNGPDDLILREFNEGHTIALHTASHDYATIYSSVDNYFNDLYSVQNRVKNITGYETKIIRFPGGSSNTISRRYSNGIMSLLTKEVLNRNFRYYDWNISSGDAEPGSHTSDEIYNNVISKLSHDKINMVLLHDIKPYTRDALKRIIEYGKSNNYTFEAIKNDTDMITQRVNN